ncbi:hypothetical protein DEO72_LG4g518 [Vigna unguiculata]|uniref:Uncharacterized protein n=1 Tax=Vigna unguiculata TaxID=3917 RepID=A0A4D6LLB9_VIGUN|nr:hypothetical protein DEO72_LG4g518 [Vigna unguiculata]
MSLGNLDNLGIGVRCLAGHDEFGKPGQPWNWCALPGGIVITAKRHRRGRNHMSLFRVGL